MKVKLHPEMSTEEALAVCHDPEFSQGAQEWLEWEFRARWVFGETPYAAIKGALQVFVVTHENSVDLAE